MTLLTLALLSLTLQQSAPESAAPPTTAAAPASADAPPAPTVAATTAAVTSSPGGLTGAPADDYGFVAWCRGALTGHMELYKQVKPEMGRLEAEKAAAQDKHLTDPAARAAAKAARAKDAKESDKLDAEQLAAGRDYLALYNRALKAAEDASPTPIQPRGVELTSQGYRIWSAARAADNRTGMWSYIMWELPARCETASKKLVANSGLLGEAFNAPPAQAEAPPAAPPEATPAPAEPKLETVEPKAEATPAPTEAKTDAAPAPSEPKADATPALTEPKAEAPATPPPLRTSPQG